MLKGSCCCKIVNFEIDGPPVAMGTCHCSRCRKVGASTILLIKKDSLTITSGRESIATYSPEKNYKYKRNFCKNCGTSLGEIISIDEMFPIPANTIDTDLPLPVSFHEFVSEKPKWYEICDTAKQFLGHPTED
jgi:hypothetical protein